MVYIPGHLLGGDRVQRENRTPKGSAHKFDCRRVAWASFLFPVGVGLSPFPRSLRKQYCSPAGHYSGIANWEISCIARSQGGHWFRRRASLPRFFASCSSCDQLLMSGFWTPPSRFSGAKHSPAFLHSGRPFGQNLEFFIFTWFHHVIIAHNFDFERFRKFPIFQMQQFNRASRNCHHLFKM